MLGTLQLTTLVLVTQFASLFVRDRENKSLPATSGEGSDVAVGDAVKLSTPKTLQVCFPKELHQRSCARD